MPKRLSCTLNPKQTKKKSILSQFASSQQTTHKTTYVNFPMHTTKSLFLCLFSFLSLYNLLNPALAATCNPNDESGLLAFKSGITQDKGGLLATWKAGTDCCKWSGITCQDPTGTRVTSIQLYGNSNASLVGTISPSLAKVENLDSIYLYNHKISGPFPRAFFKLPKLVFVYMENNEFSGPLPKDIGNMTQLGAFSVEGNRFTGTIPNSISKLTALSQLKLGKNCLTGGIPTGIKNLKQLTLLGLQENKLSGPIPDFFSSLTQLRILNFSRNSLSGKIPPSISSLAPNLIYLELGHNGLTGQIPDFIGKFTTLDTLDLSSNRLTGAVPKSFGNLTKIFNLDLSHNYLVDPFPEMNVKGIETLGLSYNKFHLGQIPTWVAKSVILTSVKLAGCGIKMKFDDWKPTETMFIESIDLSDNEISGSPVTLVNKTDGLVSFLASGNQLKFDMEKFKIYGSLKVLNLARNQVYGKLPAGIANLQKLNVSYNHLCGQIPKSEFPASAFVGNDCLCGSPLSPCK